ncbi:nudC domain-containing protein 1 [Anoplophora glabripennis]|nr:nudC domain-containing protein 1 [Anoplophora glabripennis]XP_018577531.1 nudC domain-containing protein 1 [Anoplophora glabripennis]
MGTTLIELSPNRLLLDSNFDGYKLSLQEIPIKKRDLSKPVDRILLNSSQYSLLHTKLYGLHNHLIGDHLDDGESIYFVDNEWNVCKTYFDPFSGDLIDPVIVWQVPRTTERKTGDYNVTLKFVNKSLAVLADGISSMYIVNTGARNDDDIFTLLFSDKVIGSDEGFIIVDAVSKTASTQKEELHVLLLNIKQINLEERFATFLYWVSFAKEDNHWQQIALKQLKTKSDVQYATLEKDCNAVYVVSDSGCKFTINSDCPVVADNNVQNVPKTYRWSQNIEEITIKFPLPSENINKDLVNVITRPTEIEINYNKNKLLNGQLHQQIDSELTTWTVADNNLEVVLYKNETGLMWPELVRGDQSGEYVLDSCIVQEVNEQMGHLCSDTEAMPQCGTTFTSQQVEECDFETDKAVTFERLNGLTNNITHKIYLGSHQVLLTANLNTDLPLALGIRHDVDVCLWQPQGCGDDFSISHEGTLLAFGYVQASKQNRKFSVCPPDMSYSVICESSGHLFIYRQKRPISTSELRNRTTGRKINTIAEQQVINVSNEEVIGIYPTNKILYLLCESSVKALQL